MYFFVKGINNKGKTEFSFEESDSLKDLEKKLAHNKSVSLNIHPLPEKLTNFIPNIESKPTSEDIIELMDSLHLIIKTGIPLYQGLVDLSEDSNKKGFKNMLLYIADSINSGKSLSQSFEKYEEVVGTIILNLIRIGEDTGQLEKTLEKASLFLKKTTSLKKKAKSALIYPTFAFFAVTVAMLTWMLYVLPQMTELFEGMDMDLPPLTLFIIAVSDFLDAYIWYLGTAIFGAFVLFKVAHKKSEEVRYYTDKLILKIPIIKEIVSGFNIAFISEYIYLALISGVPITETLETLVSNLENIPFRRALNEAKNDVLQGKQMSVAFSKTGIFSPFSIRMMGVGESAGSLDSQLKMISSHYYDRVDYFAENIGKVIEPVVLIFVGGFMALVIAGLMGPMYDLISNVQ